MTMHGHGTSSPPPSTETERQYQQRVALFAVMLTVLAVFGFGVRTLVTITRGHWADLSRLDHGLGLLGIALPTALWLATRTVPRSRRFIQTMEAVGLVGTAVLGLVIGRLANGVALEQALGDIALAALPAHVYAAMAGLVQHFTGATLVLTLTLVFVLRAAIVPSTSHRTAWLTGIVALPLLLIVGLGFDPIDVDPAIVSRTGTGAWIALSSFTLVWWGLVTALCTVISKTVFDLQRQIRRAKRLGQYTLDEKIGEGGMGVVYRAHHAMMRRPTAIKLLPPEKAGAANLERFEREVQLTAKLSHPNTITIYDYGRTPDGLLYYAMELLDGVTLTDLVADHGPQPVERVVRVMEQVADALAEAHDVGLVHRDIKPSNIFLCNLGGHLDVPKVLDFGLVKLAHPSEDQRLTVDDVVTGTPQTMAPEAINSPEEVDGRADLYALGAVAYIMLTGQDVFDGKTVVEICAHHLHTEPAAPSAVRGEEIPAALEQLVMRCLAKDPAARPQSAQEIVEFLQKLQQYGGMSWTDEQAREWWMARGGRSRRSLVSLADAPRTVTVCVDRTPPTLRGSPRLSAVHAAGE